MIDIINTANISVKPADRKEILRYVGVRGEADESTLELLNECLKLVDGKLNYKLCYKHCEFMHLLLFWLCSDSCFLLSGNNVACEKVGRQGYGNCRRGNIDGVSYSDSWS